MPLIKGYYITKIINCAVCNGSGKSPLFGNCDCLRSNYPRREAIIYPLYKAIAEIKHNESINRDKK